MRNYIIYIIVSVVISTALGCLDFSSPPQRTNPYDLSNPTMQTQGISNPSATKSSWNETGDTITGCGTHANWQVPSANLLVHIDFRKGSTFPCYADSAITVTASSGLNQTDKGAVLGASSFVTLEGDKLITDGSVWIVLKYPANNGKDAQVFWDAGLAEGLGYKNVVNSAKKNDQNGIGYQFEGHYCDFSGTLQPMGAGGILLEETGGSGDQTYSISEGDYLCLRYRWTLSSIGDDKGQFGFIYLGDTAAGSNEDLIMAHSPEQNFSLSSSSTGQGCEAGNVEIDGASLPMVIGKDVNSIDSNEAHFPMDGEVVAFFLFDTPHTISN